MPFRFNNWLRGKSERLTQKEVTGKIEAVKALFKKAEAAHEAGDREKAKGYLPEIYETLIVLNKRSKEDHTTIWLWNPHGDLTEAEFNELNERRKRLSDAVGIKISDGSVRHDLNP